MTKKQLKTVLAACVRTCYFGATKRTRLLWNLRKLVPDPEMFLKLAIAGHLLEEYRCGTWVAVTPVLIKELEAF